MKLIILTVMFVASGIVQTVNGQFKKDIVTSHLVYGGVQEYVLNDKAVGPSLNGYGTGFGYRISHQLADRKNAVSVSWQHVSFDDKNQTTFNSFQLRFSQGYKLFRHTSNNKLSVYAGYSVLSNPAFSRTTDNGHHLYRWLTFNSLNFYNSYHYRSGKNSFTLDINVPLIGLASTTPASGEVSTARNALIESYRSVFFTSPANYQGVSFSAEYYRLLKKGCRLFAGFSYRINELDEAQGFLDKSRQISTGMQISFR